MVITTIAVGNLVDNTGQEIPATEARQDSASLYQAKLGANRERHDTNSVITGAGARGLRLATSPHEQHEIEVDVDGTQDLRKLVHRFGPAAPSATGSFLCDPNITLNGRVPGKFRRRAGPDRYPLLKPNERPNKIHNKRHKRDSARTRGFVTRIGKSGDETAHH